MKINNQQKPIQNFGMRYNRRVVNAIMEQKNIPITARIETIQNLRRMASDALKLTSVKFFTRREPNTHRHINCMQLIIRAKEHFFKSSNEKIKIEFVNGDDRKDLLKYLQLFIQGTEHNRINKKLQNALKVSAKKFKKVQEHLCKIYPNQKEYIESCTPDKFLSY